MKLLGNVLLAVLSVLAGLFFVLVYFQFLFR